ncbi:MAG: hypothetical protein R3B09_07140 [Nannocystaceae bacterium]
MARRALLAALLALGCTEHRVTPTPQTEAEVDPEARHQPGPDAVLLMVTALDDGDGLALLREERRLRDFLVRLDVDGRRRWSRTIESRHMAVTEAELPVYGDHAVLRLHDGRAQIFDLVAGVPVADEAVLLGSIGDDAGLYAVVGAAGAPGEPVAVDLVAYPTGARMQRWRVRTTMNVEGNPIEGEPVALRLTEGHLLAYEPGRGWRPFARADGREAPAIVADADGMCEAAGSLWARRDGRLLRVDLEGPQIAVDRPADFVPAELRHQWSLLGCVGHGDEAILAISDHPERLARLVAVDRSSGEQRWSVALLDPSVTLTTTGDEASALFVQGDGLCVVDLEARALTWCERSGMMMGSDGDGVVISTYLERGRGMLERLDGAAALTASGVLEEAVLHPTSTPRGGHLWLRAEEHPPRPSEALPRLTIDTRTLTSVGPTPERPRLRARGASAEEVLRADPPPPRPPAALERHEPLVYALVGGSAPVSVGEGPPEPLHAESFARARARARLAADAPVHRLAWRSLVYVEAAIQRQDLVIAWAEGGTPEAPTWILIKAEAIDGELESDGQIRVRTYHQRPTADEVHRFALAHLDYMLFIGRDLKVEAPTGAIDDDAWLALVGEPRSGTWAFGR